MIKFEWSGEHLALAPRDAAQWEKAEQTIASQRCGDIMLTIVDEDGRPLPNVIVRYEQRTHAFEFGVHYPYEPRVYDLLQEAGINAATLWLGWKYVEPQPGLYNWGYLDDVWNPEALHRRGLRLRAHALNWFRHNWHVLPDYLLQTPVGRLPHLVYEHTSEIARHWTPYLDSYELVNEPFWPEASAMPMQMEDMVRLCNATALAVRDVTASARLEVNFAEVARLQTYLTRPCDLLTALERAEVPFDSIGLQAFENAYTATQPPAFYRPKALSSVVTALRQYVGAGKPLHVSALAVPSVPPSAPAPGGYALPYGDWTEARQAYYLDAAYTLLFAEPSVSGITWWCPVDGRHSYVTGGGLLRADLSPKPAFYALQQWIARHTSSGQTRSDHDGHAVVHGFAGDYQVTVGTGATGRRSTLTVDAQLARDETVVLRVGGSGES
jgi:GH35 family endo-1,4-beta-xylanase